MNIPLLSDKSMKIAKDYGVLDEDSGVPFRGLFIIDPKGNLRQITINDLPVGRSVDETLRLVQAFQFTDEHGEVCPAGWTPGKKTMKPDPTRSKTYFESENWILMYYFSPLLLRYFIESSIFFFVRYSLPIIGII